MASDLAVSESFCKHSCASRSLHDTVVESILQLIEGDSKSALRSKFRTGSLAMLDSDTITWILARCPLRYASYNGARLLQRSEAVSTLDFSSNPDAVALASQAANPSYFPRVLCLRLRGTTIKSLDTFLGALPPALQVLDLSFAKLSPRADYSAFASKALPRLKALSLQGTGVSVGGLSSVLPPSLATLDLSGCAAVRLGPMLDRCTQLASLRLAHSLFTAEGASGEAVPDASGAGFRGKAAAVGADGGVLNDVALALIARSKSGASLRALDLRGAHITDVESVLCLTSSLSDRMQALDLRDVQVKSLGKPTHFLRAFWPCRHLESLGLPAVVTCSLSLGECFRGLHALTRLRHLAATVRSLQVGDLPHERATAVSLGLAPATTGPSAVAAASSMQVGPWCSVLCLDVTLQAWTANHELDTRGMDPVRAAELMSDPTRGVHDMGPLMASCPQLRRLRIRGGGLSSAPGCLVWARRLTQYARVLSSSWRGIGETSMSGTPSLRKQLHLPTLRQALAKSPLREFTAEGIPAIHPRVLFILASLPRLSSLRLEPKHQGGPSDIVMSAVDARDSVRRSATASGPSGGVDRSERSSKPKGPSLWSWPNDDVWRELSEVCAPRRDSPSGENVRFAPPPRALLPAVDGPDSHEAEVAKMQEDQRWFMTGAVPTSSAVPEVTKGPEEDDDDDVAAPSMAVRTKGPEEDDDDEDRGAFVYEEDAEQMPPVRPRMRQTTISRPEVMSGPSMSELWNDTESDDEDGLTTVEAAAAALLEASQPEQADVSDDEDDFGTFLRTAGGRSKGASKAKPSAVVEEEVEPSEAVVHPPVRIDGFPSLRQLSVRGYDALTDAFAVAWRRMAPPSLRRVDVRGSEVSTVEAHRLAQCIAQREQAAFRTVLSARLPGEAVTVSKDEDDMTSVTIAGPVGAESSAGASATFQSFSVDGYGDISSQSLSRVEQALEQSLRCDEELVGEPDGDERAEIVSHRPVPCPTQISVVSGPIAAHEFGTTVVDSLAERGAMVPCQLDVAFDAMSEHMGPWRLCP
jgi:hypothetical protein